MDGKSTQDIRRAVMREFGVSYNNADRLVRTEVSYVHNQTTLARYKEMGQTQVSILIVEDGKACDICKELPGKPYDIDSAPFLPAHPRCRCCYAPWTYLDRKKWAEEHPEEGAEEAQKPELPKPGEGPKPLQNQAENGKIEAETTSDWYAEHIAGKPEMEEKYERALATAKEETQIRGTLKKPTLLDELKDFAFNDAHTNGTSGHNVTEEEARAFIQNAIVCVERADGLRQNYFSADGAAYVLMDQRQIKTAFKRKEYDQKTKTMIKEILNGLGIQDGSLPDFE